jgi:NitT/TauT family transport system permease protein
VAPPVRDGHKSSGASISAHLSSCLDSARHSLVWSGRFRFFPLLLTAINAVRNIPSVYLNAGRNFGLRPAELIFRVLYPAVVPQLLIGLRITLGIAWLVVVAAEMIAVDSGLGFLIVDARNAGNRYDLVVAGMVIIGLIGLLLDTAMRSLEKIKSFRWAYSED